MISHEIASLGLYTASIAIEGYLNENEGNLSIQTEFFPYLDD